MIIQQWIGAAAIGLGAVYLGIGGAFVLRWLVRTGRTDPPGTAPFGLPVITYVSGAVALLFSGQSVLTGGLPGWGGAVVIGLMLFVGIAPLVVALRARGRRPSQDVR